MSIISTNLLIIFVVSLIELAAASPLGLLLRVPSFLSKHVLDAACVHRPGGEARLLFIYEAVCKSHRTIQLFQGLTNRPS